MVRNIQVMIDLDLASLYGVENRSLRQTVRRNIDSFPEDFMFRLTRDEANNLIAKGVSQSVIPPGYNTGGSEMFAFTEHGVAMLATVLKSPQARKISIDIMRTFVAMRRFLSANAQVFQRLETIEYKLLESDQKFEDIYSKLEEKSLKPQQGIFFDGQIYDAYELICTLIKSAASRIILIDNYVDDSVLTMLDKRTAGVSATIYTQRISTQLALDIAKHDAQYPPIPVQIFNKSHDRFLIIDNRVYHIGASVKDLGKKWFAILEMEDLDPNELITKL
ncbi:MAG: ORF6N domain-containing protein [Bacteroidales bacterium]|nr:ORF6N domain-containing protein [Bacteroidales bacterium]